MALGQILQALEAGRAIRFDRKKSKLCFVFLSAGLSRRSYHDGQTGTCTPYPTISISIDIDHASTMMSSSIDGLVGAAACVALVLASCSISCDAFSVCAPNACSRPTGAAPAHGPGCPPRQTVVTAWGVGAAHLAIRGCEFFLLQ